MAPERGNLIADKALISVDKMPVVCPLYSYLDGDNLKTIDLTKGNHSVAS